MLIKLHAQNTNVEFFIGALHVVDVWPTQTGGAYITTDIADKEGDAVVYYVNETPEQIQHLVMGSVG